MSLASCKSFCILAFLTSSLHACAIILHAYLYSAVLASTFHIFPFFFHSLVLKVFLIQPHCLLLCFQTLLCIRLLCFMPLIQSLSITARSPEFLYIIFPRDLTCQYPQLLRVLFWSPLCLLCCSHSSLFSVWWICDLFHPKLYSTIIFSMNFPLLIKLLYKRTILSITLSTTSNSQQGDVMNSRTKKKVMIDYGDPKLIHFIQHW